MGNGMGQVACSGGDDVGASDPFNDWAMPEAAGLPPSQTGGPLLTGCAGQGGAPRPRAGLRLPVQTPPEQGREKRTISEGAPPHRGRTPHFRLTRAGPGPHSAGPPPRLPFLPACTGRQPGPRRLPAALLHSRPQSQGQCPACHQPAGPGPRPPARGHLPGLLHPPGQVPSLTPHPAPCLRPALPQAGARPAPPGPPACPPPAHGNACRAGRREGAHKPAQSWGEPWEAPLAFHPAGIPHKTAQPRAATARWRGGRDPGCSGDSPARTRASPSFCASKDPPSSCSLPGSASAPVGGAGFFPPPTDPQTQV